MKVGKKVYIVDYDLVSPIGSGRENVFSGLKSNFMAERPIERFFVGGIPLTIAAEVRENFSGTYENENPRVKEAIKYDRKFELMVAAYKLMETRLQSIFKDIPEERKSTIIGMGADVIPFETLEELIAGKTEDEYALVIDELNREKGKINSIFNPYDISAIYLADKLKLFAYQKSILTACTSSTQAIAAAYDSVLRGETDAVLAGGSDSIINALAFMAFGKLGVLAPKTDEDGRTCKPFDINRNGTLAGEAAGLCVLSNEETVKKLNIQPRFEFLGYGNSLDAYKITSPDPSGKGVVRAIQTALKNAGVTPGQIDYINLHGTGTRSNDDAELKALKEVFGDHIKNIPISSTKDRHGHAIAAAGIQEFCILCMAMENDFIPCTVNLKKPFATDFDFVMNENRTKKINIGMTCNFAFGGINSVLIIKKIQ